LGDEFPFAAVLKIQQKLGTTKKYVKKWGKKRRKLLQLSNALSWHLLAKSSEGKNQEEMQSSA